MKYASVSEMLDAVRGALQLANGVVTVTNPDLLRDELIDRLAHTAVFGDAETAAAARWLVWKAAWEVGVFDGFDAIDDSVESASDPVPRYQMSFPAERFLGSGVESISLNYASRMRRLRR